MEVVQKVLPTWNHLQNIQANDIGPEKSQWMLDWYSKYCTSEVRTVCLPCLALERLERNMTDTYEGTSSYTDEQYSHDEDE